MRIVHITYTYNPTYRDPEAWLRRIDFFVALLEQMAKHEEVISIHYINYEGSLMRGGVVYHFLRRPVFQNIFPIQIHALVKQLNPDAILVHGIHMPWQVLWLRCTVGKNVKIAIQHHSERPLRHYKRYLQKKWVDGMTDAYFFPSHDQARAWVEQRQIASLDKVIEVMEVPSVFQPIERQLAKSVTGVGASKTYLWVGRFDANKDPITLIKSFIRFAKACQHVSLYVIYQQDDLIDEVKMLLAEHPGIRNQITLMGRVDHAGLLHWFNSADFFISTSHYEGMGIAVSEAMSCGCIPILTNIPSFVAMTERGTCGLHFEPGNSNDLFRALGQSDLMDLGEERWKVLRQYRDKLSAAAISDTIVRTFANLVKSGRDAVLTGH